MKKHLLGILLCMLMMNHSLSASASIETVQFDFDSAVLDSSVKSSSFKESSATALFSKAASGTTVTVKNSDDVVVPDNPSTNKFVKFDYKGDAGNETAVKLTLTPIESFKEDFSFEFDFALNRLGAGEEGYNEAYNPFLYITVMPNIQEDRNNAWKYASKIVIVDQAMNIKIPITNMISPNCTTGCTKFASSYVAGSGFARMKVVTRFVENDYPVYDVYVKFPGSSEFLTVVSGKRYAAAGYGNASLPASVYNEHGIESLTITMSTGEHADAQVSSNIFHAAVDNLKIRTPEFLSLDPIYSDKMVIPKNGKFDIRGNGLDEGNIVSADICKSTGTKVLSTSTTVLADNSFKLSFSDTSALSEDDVYYIDVKSGALSKHIDSVLCGNVVVFDGESGYAAPTENLSRVYEDGVWYDIGEYTGYDYERTVAGNISGVVVGEENVALLPANYIVYTIYDQKLNKTTLTDYVESAIAEGKKVLFRGALNDTTLSADKVFEIESALNDLSRKYYGDVLFVPAFDDGNYAQRMGDVLSGAKSLFNWLDVSVNDNKVYIALSDVPKSVDADSFMCEDIDGNVYMAESADINGNIVELTFGNDEAIIRVMYGKSGLDSFIYSSKDNMPLSRFTAEFMASDKYDFSNQYDMDKFFSMYTKNNADINKSADGTVVISQKTTGDFGIERKNLYYSTDDIEIKIGVQSSQKIKLIADDKLFFEGTTTGEDTISLTRSENKLYVNGQEATENISLIQNLRVEFCDCSQVALNSFEISMSGYSKILTLISDLKDIPDVQNAKYNDKASIQKAYEAYVLLDGDNNSYFTSEQKSKMKALGNLLERYQAAEQKIKENVSVKSDAAESYTGNKANQIITLTNKNYEVPYSMICIAAAYSPDGRLISISSQDVELDAGENQEINLKFDIEGASSVDIYVLKDLSGGYVIYKTVDIPVK